MKLFLGHALLLLLWLLKWETYLDIKGTINYAYKLQNYVCRLTLLLLFSGNFSGWERCLDFDGADRSLIREIKQSPSPQRLYFHPIPGSAQVWCGQDGEETRSGEPSPPRNPNCHQGQLLCWWDAGNLWVKNAPELPSSVHGNCRPETNWCGSHDSGEE